MNEDYLMRPADTFVSRECGCSMTVITGPVHGTMATMPPRCCCGHDMVKDTSFIGGVDVFEAKEEKRTVLPGMVG